MLVLSSGNTRYIYAFTKNVYGLEINRWYTTSDFNTFSEYVGTAPIFESSQHYSESYTKQIINSFN